MGANATDIQKSLPPGPNTRNVLVTSQCVGLQEDNRGPQPLDDSSFKKKDF